MLEAHKMNENMTGVKFEAKMKVMNFFSFLVTFTPIWASLFVLTSIGK